MAPTDTRRPSTIAKGGPKAVLRLQKIPGAVGKPADEGYTGLSDGTYACDVRSDGRPVSGDTSVRREREAHIEVLEEDNAGAWDDSAPHGTPETVGLSLETPLSKPLQELQPEVNALPRTSQDVKLIDNDPMSENETLEAEYAEPDAPLGIICDSVSPSKSTATRTVAAAAPTPSSSLTNSIQSLYARTQAARSHADGSDRPKPRKKRALGRAASNMSNQSIPTSVSFSRNNSTEGPHLNSHSTSLGSGPVEGIDRPRSAAAPPVPSQQLSYEAPDAREHEAKMAKAMGYKIEVETGRVRVESKGVVRDTVIAADGVGSRVRARARHGKGG
ncbi:hypothetical protein LTR66_000922 [Elasticomyces elasticus]|nr:hypothetical protein LTR66_000922 [Elasticomyces elasticus]